MPRFLDFHLMVNKIADEEDDRFVTVVTECPARRFEEVFGQFHLRRTEVALWQAENLPLSFGRDGEQRFQVARDTETARQISPEEIGETLFRLLFPPRSDSLDLLGRSCELLGGDDFLRLKLELHPHLANLPWELLECPLAERWAAQINHANLSIVRYLGNTPRSPATPPGAKKPSIIIVKSDPREVAQREVTESLARELRNLEDALCRVDNRVNYHIIEDGATLAKLVQRIQSLRDISPVVGLHFMGHGGMDHRGGYFAGEDEERQIHPLYAKHLRNALTDAPAIRWMILNACWTGNTPFHYPLAGLATSMSVLKDIPTVVAFQRPVGTKDAESLAVAFYEQVLGEGRAVEEVIRSVQVRSKTPGALVVLVRAVEGRIPDIINLGGQAGQAPTGAPAQIHPPAAGRRVGGNPPRQPAPAPLPGEMLPIPAGPFQKGLTSEEIDTILAQFRDKGLRVNLDSARQALSEETWETVDLPAFRIGKTPVTNAQFRQFVEATSHRTDAERAGDPKHWRIHDVPEKANHPVVYVSFHDADAYCRWAGKSLPTADQWKKAFRGTDGRIYPWGDTFDPKLCNTGESCRGFETTAVDKFPSGASPYGCLDMVGNVEEWTVTTQEDGTKAIFGGSWAMSCQVYGLPVLQRLARPGFYSNDLGFRCVDEGELE
jgi:formylglycine-generating enzyme required for sulfatase activity